MTEKNGLIKAESREQLPEKDLIAIPHNNRTLKTALFGPSTYKNNLEAMQKKYFHSKELLSISFNPTTTSQSISAASWNFGQENKEYDAKRDIFDPKWLQAGYIVRTQDGVFTNTTNIDENSLKQLLNKAEKVNGIYLIDDKIAFAPYESFERGIQDCETFASGGLARALEHTNKKVAKNLKEIASPKFYKIGVNVWGFDDVKEPLLRVVSLVSDGGIGTTGWVLMATVGTTIITAAVLLGC